MFRPLFAWIQKYERHLSAAAMVAGFVADNVFFSRIDLPQTQALFVGYIALAAASIALLHFFETRAGGGRPLPRFRFVLPLLTQFALGGMWSGFLIFYARSADLSASWPFLFLLALIFLGNEVFGKYHDRLVFTTLLLFFGLYSYAILAVPVFTGLMGTSTFLLSGLIAAVLFALFLILLRLIGRTRFLAERWRIRGGALAILAVVNLFYFTNILPPLPLALQSAGTYHSVSRGPAGYAGEAEPRTWRESLGFAPVEHMLPGETLYAFSAVFAPVKLSTTIVHRWEHYDEREEKWITESRISFPILGGRDGGYRGYSAKSDLAPGSWRVGVETADGRVIGRIRFKVETVSKAPPLRAEAL
ncbi:MAG: DUF2914 domain-containing protein [bacterium]